MPNPTKTKRILLILTSLLALGTALPSAANPAIDWLITTAQTNGAYTTENDIATPFTATAETLQTQNFPSTKRLSQTLILHALAGQALEPITSQLITRLNLDGGIGDLSDYDSTIIDTAWALNAPINAIAVKGNHKGLPLQKWHIT
ncbi:hypothetical protein PN36_12090 [Candidatus Thiomargarita nelsonii]|uniref:Secreted protein n=1 Tax=Candidatus Thiomargarita nelsonii TaxID=1003181 RepID=A0A4E0R2W0_9GAMM|nr:hypothetical protein PN36_12090 [Candidatus Thiomargarita nelsonii]